MIQDYRKTHATHRIGLSGDKPAANEVLAGTLYFSMDTLVLERSDGAIWSPYSITIDSPNLDPSVLLGRGDVAGDGSVQTITLSSSLIMTGTELSVRTGVYNFTYNNTITAPPAAGQVRLDQAFATWNIATKVWVRFVSADGQDLYWGIMIIPVGATLLIQDKDDHTRYGRFVTSGVPIDNGLYAEIPVTWVASGTAILTAQQVFLRTSGG